MLTQYILSGITIGAIYALVALGFAIIYNASHVINFAQGEFVMIGGMATAAFFEAGIPLPAAVALSIATATLVGVLLEKLAVEPARDASVVTLIIITIGASILLRGLATLVWDKKIHRVPAFSGESPISLGGATLLPQVLWVLGVSAVAVALLAWFFRRTLTGKAILAVSHNRFAARLMGISVRRVLAVSFGLSAALGAGYLSSAYKDVFAFLIIIAALVFLPNGLLGRGAAERV